MAEVMEGARRATQIAGLLIGLAMKGERPREIVGLARTMRAHAVQAVADVRATSSTRAAPAAIGRAPSTFPRCAALVVAACGVRVAKHGNRSVSSLSGSADVFEALGVRVTASPAVVERLPGAGGHRVLLRADVPSVDAPRRADAARARRADRVQPARAADQPRRRHAAARRRAAAGVHRAAGAIAACCSAPSARGSCTAPMASTRSRRPATRRSPSAATARSTRSTCIRLTSACRKRAPAVAARRRRATRTPGSSNGILDGERGPPRDVVLLNAGAALFIAGADGVDRRRDRRASRHRSPGREAQRATARVDLVAATGEPASARRVTPGHPGAIGGPARVTILAATRRIVEVRSDARAAG